MNILFVIDKYLDLHSERNTFHKNLNANLIKVTDVLSDIYPSKELLQFTEFLLVLAIISPSKDNFLDRVEDLSEETITHFLNVVEIYIKPEEYDEKNKRNTKYSILKITQTKRNTGTFSNFGMSRETSKSNLTGNNFFNNVALENEYKQQIFKLNEEVKDYQLKMKELQHSIDILNKDDQKYENDVCTLENT